MSQSETNIHPRCSWISTHHNLPKVVYASYLSLINKDTSQAVTFIGSSLQGKYLGSLFHYMKWRILYHNLNALGKIDNIQVM